MTVSDLRSLFRAARRDQPENRAVVRVLTRLRKLPAHTLVPPAIAHAAMVWGEPLTGCRVPRCPCRVAVA